MRGERKKRIGKKEKGDAMRHQPSHLPHWHEDLATLFPM